MIEVQHVTKRYGPVTAVDDVSFRVDSGQILGFLGPNGAGKTTTMRILTGCTSATDGQALVAGYDVFEEPVEAKRRTGYLPETPPLYPDMTVREYLTFAARINGIRSAALRERVGAAMARTSVEDVADRHCGRLSKGYRQRVGLAQAILHNPDVLILDEPTAGLDPKQIIETRELIKELAGDHTIILSTHILPEVAQTCERVVIIDKGRVVAVDTPDNLTGRLQGSETIRVEIDPLGAESRARHRGGGRRHERYGHCIGQRLRHTRGPVRPGRRRTPGPGPHGRLERVGAAGAGPLADEPGGHLPRTDDVGRTTGTRRRAVRRRGTCRRRAGRSSGGRGCVTS